MIAFSLKIKPDISTTSQEAVPREEAEGEVGKDKEYTSLGVMTGWDSYDIL